MRNHPGERSPEVSHHFELIHRHNDSDNARLTCDRKGGVWSPGLWITLTKTFTAGFEENLDYYAKFQITSDLLRQFLLFVGELCWQPVWILIFQGARRIFSAFQQFIQLETERMAFGKPASKGAVEEATERLLIEAAQKDPARFAEIYEQNFDIVYAYIARRVRERSAAEDLTAEVFGRALEFLPRFTWRGAPLAAWLLRIAANIVTDRAKRAARESSVGDLDDATLISQFNLDELQESARLFRLVDQLPADQGHVIRLRFAEDKSIREIAQEINRSEGAVKQLQFRGLEKLRALFAGESGERNG